MTATAERLKVELSQLPSEERAALAAFLLESLDDGEDPDAQTAWDAELRRRWAEIQSGQAMGKPADEVFAALREKYS